MNDFLDKARRRIAAGAYALTGPALESHGSFARAARGGAIVAELKPESPSEGPLLRMAPKDMLDAYKQGGAAALSILTASDDFAGDPHLLRTAHAVALPTLMKDFIIDEAQLQAAAQHGASAVLLIERAFAQAATREALVEAAHGLGLEVLLEVHDPAEWLRAKGSTADVIGVNARDLETLAVDVEAARRLVQAVHDAGRQVIALSGIRNRRDRQAAVRTGADAVLVGTFLMRQDDPGLALLALRRPIAKTCGLRTARDVDAAADAGADLAGFIMGAPGSPRNLGIEEAAPLMDHARLRGLRTVLVTPAGAADVMAWCHRLVPDYVQLAGPVRAKDVADVSVRPLKVVAPDGTWPARGGIVVDTPHPAGGGSGTTHDWSQTTRLVAQAPDRLSLVAGGLDADNVLQALQVTGAWGADASSGLETGGEKDPHRMRAFVAAVHGAP